MRDKWTRRAATIGCALAAPVAFAACGSSTDSTTTTTTAATTTTTVLPGTTTTAPAPTTTVPTPMLSIDAFYSPTKNINCELPNRGITTVFCETMIPPRTARMTPDGVMTEGTDVGNAGVGTPILPYGSSTTVAPFTCLSATTGVTCTTTGGRGFTIAGSGITRVG